MPSRRYTELRARVDDLKSRFIGIDMSFERDATDHEKDLIASFRLLVHAEVEMFIEDRVKGALAEDARAWRADHKLGKSLLNVLIEHLPAVAQDRKRVNNRDDLKRRVEDCLARAIKEVDENNGIKRDTFLRLAFSAGILRDDVPEPLLTALDGYGRHRGDVAHKGVGRVRSLNAPSAEGSMAIDLVTLLKDFDTLIGDGAEESR